MLVLSRRRDEVLRLTYEYIVIDITVVGIRKNDIKLGITAPRSVQILRGELLTAEDIADPPTADIPGLPSTIG